MRPIAIVLLVLVGACTQSDRPISTPETSAIEGSSASTPGELICWAASTSGDESGQAFRDVTAAAGLIEPLVGLHGHAAAVGEFNGDQIADLVVGTFADRPDEIYQHRGADGPRPDQLLGSTPSLVPVPDWSTEMG